MRIDAYGVGGGSSTRNAVERRGEVLIFVWLACWKGQ